MNAERQMNRQALQALRAEEADLEEKLERELTRPPHPVALDVPWADLPEEPLSGQRRRRLGLRW